MSLFTLRSDVAITKVLPEHDLGGGETPSRLDQDKLTTRLRSTQGRAKAVSSPAESLFSESLFSESLLSRSPFSKSTTTHHYLKEFQI